MKNVLQEGLEVSYLKRKPKKVAQVDLKVFDFSRKSRVKQGKEAVFC